MSQASVERTLGKLLTDEGFREQFFREPRRAAYAVGLDLTPEELDAILRVPRARLLSLAARLDDRICRLHVPLEHGRGPGWPGARTEESRR